MGYQVQMSGLGIDPTTAFMVTKFGYSGLKKLFGTAPPEKPFPWRWDKPGREVGFTGFPNPRPGYFGIVYSGSKHETPGWHRVWAGSIKDCFDRPGFDISGTMDAGQRAWRAFVRDGKLQVVEDFGQGWVPTFAGTRQQLSDWTGAPSSMRPSAPITPTEARFVTLPSVPFGVNGYMPLLIGLAGVAALVLIPKMMK